MAIPFTCPHCGAQTNVDDRYAGQTGPCSHCGKSITIPFVAGGAAPPPPRGGGSGLVIVAVVIGGLFAFLACAGILIALLLPALQVARSAARKAQSTNNLKQIGLALHSYHQRYGAFPPAYIADENGRPMHSWRVLILPYMEQQALYDQYRFDEPWDGPNNSRLHEVMVPAFVDPNSSDDSMGYTNYVVVNGPNTMFPGAESVALGDVPDGASNTILVTSLANSDILWCEPRDLNYDAMSFVVNDPGSESISSEAPGPVPVLLGDGSVRQMHESVDPSAVRSMILRDDRP